jgi:hypothetical protein
MNWATKLVAAGEALAGVTTFRTTRGMVLPAHSGHHAVDRPVRGERVGHPGVLLAWTGRDWAATRNPAPVRYMSAE